MELDARTRLITVQAPLVRTMRAAYQQSLDSGVYVLTDLAEAHVLKILMNV